MGWTQPALDQRQWYIEHDAGWERDLSRWRRLTPAEQIPLREGTNFGPMGPANAVWMEPAGRAAALVIEIAGATPLVRRLSPVPRVVREALGLPSRVPARSPASARRAPEPQPALETEQNQPDPTPVPAVDEAFPAEADAVTVAQFVPADALRITHWNVRALRDARTAGLSEIPPQWLSLLTPVPVAACTALARHFGWALARDRTYAVRRGAGYIVLLAVTGQDGLCAVVRCAREPSGAAP